MEAVSAQDREALYRAAVGAKKADFYVPKFIRFDHAGASKLSWNWPALFVSFYWFLYRRMYRSWAINLNTTSAADSYIRERNYED
jgi:hypothetical protein